MAWDLFPRLLVCYFSLLSSSLAVCSASWDLKIIIIVFTNNCCLSMISPGWTFDKHCYHLTSEISSSRGSLHCLWLNQNISLPTLLLNINSTIIIWLTFSSISGIVIKLGKYLDKFCLIDLKKKKSFSLWLHPFLRRLWVPLSWGCLTLQSRKQPWNSFYATRNTVT